MSRNIKNSSKNIRQQLEMIRQALQNFKNGASIEEIMEATGLAIELRTLQRRLLKLKQEGRISVSGGTRSTRYHLVKEITAQHNTVREESPAYSIPLSKASKEIIAKITLPEIQRIPVGYNRAFLESYQPNIDRYLSKADQQQLRILGKTEKGNQPAGTYAREILSRLLIDLSWNSSRLEGNTYSLLETERLLSLGEATETKTAMEAQMILNHKDAIEFLVPAAEDHDIGINRYTILNLHALLSHNLLADRKASGRLRQFGVGISRSVFTPLRIPQLIEEMFELILEKAAQIEDPFEQAFFMMVHIPYLQPFDDVNKRVARLAVNIPFNRSNLAPVSFIDVPKDLYIQGLLAVYELNRIDLLKDVFLWAYERSALRYAAIQQTIGEPDPFRLKYRNAIRIVIKEVVSNALSKKDASIKIVRESSKLPEEDRAKFVHEVETELLSLHDGNFARYLIRPSEFKAWKDVWKR